jgi:hypothetical protein
MLYSFFSRTSKIKFSVVLMKIDVAISHETERTTFQTHYFSENLVAPGIELGPLDL